METGFIHIYHGNGKGKTTAAIGLAVRCAGGGGKVLVYQFLKDGTSGEIEGLKAISNVKVMDAYEGAKFSFLMNEEEKKEASVYYKKIMQDIDVYVANHSVQLLILDEVLHAVRAGFITEDELIAFLENRPKDLEVVMTGMKPAQRLCDMAEYITEMTKVKHPYDRGVGARKLIEK